MCPIYSKRDNNSVWSIFVFYWFVETRHYPLKNEISYKRFLRNKDQSVNKFQGDNFRLF